jgi:hypothetical protein
MSRLSPILTSDVKGFPQFFWCPTVIFRAGPDTAEYGDPWDFALLVEFPWLQIVRRTIGLRATCTIWALSTKGKEAGDRKVNWSYAVPLFRWLKKTGFTPEWERICDKTNPEMGMD